MAPSPPSSSLGHIVKLTMKIYFQLSICKNKDYAMLQVGRSFMYLRGEKQVKNEIETLLASGRTRFEIPVLFSVLLLLQMFCVFHVDCSW